MKLQEAIEIVKDWQDGKDITSFDDVNRAAKLLIEAGEAIQSARANNYWTPIPPLPGETEE